MEDARNNSSDMLNLPLLGTLEIFHMSAIEIVIFLVKDRTN